MNAQVRGTKNHTPRALRTWRRSLLIVGVPVALLIGAASAFAAPGTLKITDETPTLGKAIEVQAPGGGTFTADPGHATALITPEGGSAFSTSAWCVDYQHGYLPDYLYDVDLQTAADAPILASWQEAGWLIGRADAMIAAAADPNFESAAIQVAIWQMTGNAADVHDVTGNAALNDRVAEIRALAAGKAPASALAMTGPGGNVTVGATGTVTVTGTPGAEVALSVLSGNGTLSQDSVTLDASGAAQVQVTANAAGQIVVGGTAAGGILWRAAHLPDQKAPQDQAYLVPTQLTAQATLTAETAVTPPSATTGTTTPARAILGLGKLAPHRALVGTPITYTITVTNRSSVTAKGVVVRDYLPSGLVAVNMPKSAGLSHGVVSWRIGDMAPKAKVTLRITLRTTKSVRRTITNTAKASAANARTVLAKAATRITPLPAAAQPAVTG